MLINEGQQDLNRVKEVKVKIPVTYHIKLHSMKVLTGKQISEAVTEALESYFDEMRAAAEAASELGGPTSDDPQDSHGVPGESAAAGPG